jgi:hypothetical protein
VRPTDIEARSPLVRARRILTPQMARVATVELIQRLEASLQLFPELGAGPVTVGVTASPRLDGLGPSCGTLHQIESLPTTDGDSVRSQNGLVIWYRGILHDPREIMPCQFRLV